MNNSSYNIIQTKVIIAILFTIFCALLIIPLNVCAQPQGRIAYAVSGFNDKVGRLDFNLHMTTFTPDGDYKTLPLNQSGMYPAWGPKGDTLYFIQRAATQSDIYSIDINNPRNKTKHTPISGTYRFLAVSPNGKKLAFNGWTNEQKQQDNQIWVLDIASGEMEVMTQIPHFGRSFFFWGITWSPNSKQLAFSLERSGGLEQLYILDTETKEIDILTELNIDFYPVWAPDGKSILFRRWSREFDTLTTIDVETRAIKPLFDVDKQTGMWTDWSFDGQQIIYSRWGVFYLHNLEDGKTEQLFEIEGSIFVISWWKHEVLPVEPREKLATTWGAVKQSN